MNICKDCKHCRHDVQNWAAPNVWYNWFCGHPDLRREPMRDPITGEEGYVARNDLGTTYVTNIPYPYCRDMNPIGSCTLFAE